MSVFFCTRRISDGNLYGEKMNIREILIPGVVAIVAGIVFGIMLQDNRRLTGERDAARRNAETLLGEVEVFKVRDSLNAARVQSLELSVKEFERFRAEDARLIRELKAKNRDLSAVNKTQSQTIIELRAIPRDTIVIRDSVQIPAVAVHCGDAWFDFDGVLTAVDFTGTLQNRDSLVLAESVRYRRFLGFLWKTRRVQDRRLDVVSKNPHTEILGVEHIILEK